MHGTQDLIRLEFYEERKTIVNGDQLPDRAFQSKPDGYKIKILGCLLRMVMNI